MQARFCFSVTDCLNGRPNGDRVKVSPHFDTQTIAETDMDPGLQFLLLGHAFNKCPNIFHWTPRFENDAANDRIGPG